VNLLYDKPDFSNTVRQSNIDALDTLKSLTEAWKNNDFKQVISLSESIDQSNKNYFRSQEILGHAFFRLNQFGKAENWYRLLCLIALKKNDDATALLNAILNNKNHKYYSDAEKLNSLWQK
jgi:hypothetical protein